MKTQQINNISFGTALKLKSKSPIFLNLMEDVSFSHFNKKEIIYDNVATSTPDKDGFFHAYLLDKAEFGKNRHDVQQSAKEAIIEKVEDLKNIPMLKKFIPIIDKNAKCFGL